MSEQERSELAGQYRDMPEEGLLQLARQYESLTSLAQELLQDEFARRSLEPPIFDPSVASEQADDDSVKLATVGVYRDLPAAIVARSVLESAGITCFLFDEYTVRLQWAWSNLIGGMKLQVPVADESAAHDLLSQPMPPSMAVEGEDDFIQPSCPQCGSLDVAASDTDRKVKAASWLIGIPLPYFSRSQIWKCGNCGCKWEDDEDPQSESSVTPPNPLR